MMMQAGGGAWEVVRVLVTDTQGGLAGRGKGRRVAVWTQLQVP